MDEVELKGIATATEFIDRLESFDTSLLQESQEEHSYEICFTGTAYMHDIVQSSIVPYQVSLLKFFAAVKKNMCEALQYSFYLDSAPFGDEVTGCLQQGN